MISAYHTYRDQICSHDLTGENKMGEAKNTHHRLKILYLYNILLEKTDENHYITMSEIISQLELCGISAARKAIYDDLDALKAYGLDIVQLKGNKSGYYVASREFELPELKLLADAVSSSRFLTKKKSDELLSKIEKLSSVYEAKQMKRQVFIANRVKSMNERIYLNVDVINRAVEEGKKISFRYFDFDISKEKKYRDGERVCSPFTLAWNDEQYYLIAHYEKRNAITNFRVDRMEDVTVLEEDAVKMPDDFSIAEYMNSSFSMFSGESQEVKLRFHTKLVNSVLDRFGKEVTMYQDGEDHFTVRVKVKPEPPFFGWLFQFGTNAEIIEPVEQKIKYKEQLEAVLTQIKT